MNWLFEDPITICVVGGVIELILLLVVWSTRRGIVLLGMLFVALVTGGCLLIERLVLTDREQVEESLSLAAEAIENGNVNALKPLVASSSQGLVGDAEAALKQFQIDYIKIAALEVKILEATPNVAHADFICRAGGKGRAIDNFPIDAARRVRIRLVREGDTWRIERYDHSPLVQPGGS